MLKVSIKHLPARADSISSEAVKVTVYIDEYRCDRCGLQAIARFGEIGYYSIEAARIAVPTINAWCNYCRTITSVENLPPIDWLDAELLRLQNGHYLESDIEFAASWGQAMDESVASRISTYTALAAVARNRQASNRCIECGTNDFAPLVTIGDVMPQHYPHRECGGRMQHISQYHAIPEAFFLLDKEGIRIR